MQGCAKVFKSLVILKNWQKFVSNEFSIKNGIWKTKIKINAQGIYAHTWKQDSSPLYPPEAEGSALCAVRRCAERHDEASPFNAGQDSQKLKKAGAPLWWHALRGLHAPHDC